MDSHHNPQISQWSDHFPAGLRVLVVDDDPTHSNILQHMLTSCNYQVTTCNTMRAALDLLRESDEGFDVVISDVNLPDMDGFKLLEHVALKMRIPVIMMSVDGDTSRVMRGVQHGACDYLLKPIRIEELRNIWQHVVRKRILEGRGEIVEPGERPPPPTGRKRKDAGAATSRHDGGESTTKKARVVWSADLHHKFVKAVDLIGVDKAGPKKILDLMGVPWLTRENVASHLQKYRLYLRRKEQESAIKPAPDWMNLSRISSVDPASSGSVCLQSSIRQTSVTVQHNVVTNGIYEVPRHKVQIHREDSKGILASTQTNALYVDPAYLPISSASRISYNRFIGPMDSESRNKSHFQLGHHFDSDHLTVPMTHGGVYDNLESSLKSLIVGTGGSALRISGDEFNEYSTQGDLYPNLGSFGCSNPEGVADVSQQMYDPLNFDCGGSDELLECLEINQGV